MNVACTQCGTPSPPGNRFCGLCGTPLPPSPGNLPPSTRYAPSAPSAPSAPPGYAPPPYEPPPQAPPVAAPPVSGASTPCWQCGTAVDPLRQPACPICGAHLVMAAPGASTPAMAGPPQAGFDTSPPLPYGSPGSPPGPPPPFAVAGPATDPGRRREPLVSGALLTVVVAIGIVLVLAVVGIIAGQAIGR